MHQPKFAVLLAAYNGMQWIADQLDSILAQKDVIVQIFISIDTSSDDTLNWCLSKATQDTRITVLPSTEHFGGAAKNFFHLIREVDFRDFDYIAFADQDDLWLPDKLSTAHNRIIDGNYAAYSGNVTAFWEDGRQMLINKAQPQRKYDFLFEAAGPGCTYVLRTSYALKFKFFLIQNWDAVNGLSLHDWFIYAWYRANNLPWYIDIASKILYRQHNHNQVGANQGIKAILKRLAMIRSGWYYSEINKFSCLLRPSLYKELPEIYHSDTISRRFIIQNSGQIRRRLRDRLFLFILVMFRIY